jgi:1,2-diacylglycerol 3-beta-galactosyltransferase
LAWNAVGASGAFCYPAASWPAGLKTSSEEELMNLHHSERPKVLFLFSDTGGGHRSAAEAIIESLSSLYPDQIDTEMVDIFRAAPPPMELAITTYPAMAKMPGLWGTSFKFSNERRRARMIQNAFWPYVRRAASRLIDEHPADLIVSVHPVPNNSILRAMTTKTPYLIVITDLVSTHVWWYDPRADLIVVPTEEARLRGIELGLHPNQLEVVGLPVADRFCRDMGTTAELRTRLGWSQDYPVVLMVSGGDGMGPLGRTAVAIDKARLPVSLAIVTGRNVKLRSKLENRDWNCPTKIYGFVRDMPQFMRASNVLITKAGPGTISEAFIAGLPIILYSRMPGQEEGNVTYVVEKGAGVWAPEPEQVVDTLRQWLDNPSVLNQVANNSRRLSRPQASQRIARIIAQHVGMAEAKEVK